MVDESPAHTLVLAASGELAEAVGMLGSLSADVVVTDSPANVDPSALAAAVEVILVPGDDADWLQAALSAVAPHTRVAGNVRVVAGATRSELSNRLRGALDGWSIVGVHVDPGVVSVDVQQTDPNAQSSSTFAPESVGLLAQVVLGRGRELIEGHDDIAALAAARLQCHENERELHELKSALGLHWLTRPSGGGEAAGGTAAARPTATEPPPSKVSSSGSARSRLTRKVLLVAGAALFAIALIVGLTVGGVISTTEALGIACLGGLLVVLADQRRRAKLITNRLSYGLALAASAQKSINSVGNAVSGVSAAVEEASARASASSEITRVVLAGEARGASDRLLQLERHVHSLSGEVGSALGRHADELAKQVETASSVLQRSLRRTYEQIESNMRLRDVVDVTGLTPPLRQWAASPDIIAELVGQLRRRRPKTIVECGSGASTVWLALACRSAGVDARIVSVEHDAAFAEATRQALADCGVADRADVVVAPLSDVTLGGVVYQWYAPTAWDVVDDIDLLFVDGPPSSVGVDARYPAVPMLWERFSQSALIVLDDTVRTEERLIVDRWVEEFPELELTMMNMEKGAALLNRRRT